MSITTGDNAMDEIDPDALTLLSDFPGIDADWGADTIQSSFRRGQTQASVFACRPMFGRIRKRPLRQAALPTDANWQAIPGRARLGRLRQDSDLEAAYSVRKGEWRYRAELEARVVADQPTDDIAQSMQLSAAVVGAYEHWFFDIRRHLTDERQIYRLIGRKPGDRLKRRDVPACWKWAAYEFGLPILEQLRTATNRRTLVRDGVDAYWQSEAKLDDGVKVIIALRRMPSLSSSDSKLAARLRTVLDQLAARHPKLPEGRNAR